MEHSGPSTDMQAFRELFAKARNIVALSGAGISAESGVPTFRLGGQMCTILCGLDNSYDCVCACAEEREATGGNIKPHS